MRSIQVLRRSLQRRAFTLIEIIVVATLISLLSGIALFSINEMYIRNIRKVSFAEAYQLATALSIVENDVDFYPRLNFLRLPKELVLVEPNSPPPVPANESAFSESTAPTSMLPGLDYWGIYRHDAPPVLKVLGNWNGPYMGVSQARQDANRGAQSGIIKMRIPDLAENPITVNGLDTSLVDWPADPFGNPYLLYQFKAVIDPDAQVNIPLFLEDPTDDASWRNMIVSYGRNNFPGGNENTSPGFGNNSLLPGALYVPGDEYGGEADFTLKVMDRRSFPRGSRTQAQFDADDALMAAIEARNPDLLLANDPADVAAGGTGLSQHYFVLRSFSIEIMDSGNYQIETGQVGVVDPGSDDIVLEF